MLNSPYHITVVPKTLAANIKSYKFALKRLQDAKAATEWNIRSKCEALLVDVDKILANGPSCTEKLLRIAATTLTAHTNPTNGERYEFNTAERTEIRTRLIRILNPLGIYVTSDFEANILYFDLVSINDSEVGDLDVE